MFMRRTLLVLACITGLGFAAIAADENTKSDNTATNKRSRLKARRESLANYDQVTNGMTKTQVERITGPPAATETKDMLVFKKTTYRYEEGSKFALFTFKNDELDSKDSNLTTQ